MTELITCGSCEDQCDINSTFLCTACGFDVCENCASAMDGVCKSCFDDNYSVCGICGGYEKVDNFYSCHYPEIDNICRSCFNERFRTCEICNRAYYTYEHDECPNNRCRQRRQGIHSAISSYGFKPRPKYMLAARETMETSNHLKFPFLMGLEIEVNIPSRRYSDLGIQAREDFAARYCTHDTKKILYYKTDGSIEPGYDRGMGVECVTYPMSWAWMHENEDWINPFTQMSKDGIISYFGHQCGMHIHVDKRCFKPSNIFRIASFLKGNEKFLLKFTGRSKTQLSSWARLNYDERSFPRQVREGRSYDRYTALNISESTIEFRLFRGTLNEKGIKKNIEFCKSIRDHSLETNKITVPSYYSFLSANRKEFPNAFAKVFKITEGGEKCV